MEGDDLLKEFLGEEPRRQLRERSDGFGTSERFVPMLDFVKVDGSRFALPYSMLIKVEFSPSKAIALRYSADDVLIVGYRLEAVHKAIIQHRAREVKETGKQAVFEREGSEPVITLIKCQPAS